ncbi:MAG: hypothetical protein ACHQ51_09880 [Elusimicrobiota bacterium]
MLITLLACLLGMPCAAASTPPSVPTSTSTPVPTPPPGTLDSSKIRLDAHDVTGALADAELVVAKGGGADAYAARADAKRAQGQPMDAVLADYAEAAKLDPRYIEKYQGLIAQIESEKHPKKAKGGTGLGGVPVGFIAAGILVGLVCVAGGVSLSRDRSAKLKAPDDEAIHADGKKVEPSAKDVPDDPDKPKKDIS